jgi:drug/metabolite transporter (DMT)-like permease
LWYAALPALTATSAAVIQLSVPVIAALGGALLLAEPLSSRLVIASATIMGGIALTILRPRT